MKEGNRFYSSLGLLIILNAAIKPLWIFGIDRQLQNETGTAIYGLYFSLLNFSILFSFLLDWGITSFFNRQVAAQKEGFNNNALFFLKLKLAFALIYAFAVFIAALILDIREWGFLVCIVAIQILTSLFLFIRSIFTAQQWFTTDAWLSVLDKTLMILICGLFFYIPVFSGTITIRVFLTIQLTCLLIAILVSAIILIKKGFRFTKNSASFSLKNLLFAAFPYACIVLLMSIHYRLDGFLLRQIKHEQEAGVYAGAYRILDAANMVGYLTASFLLPYIARHRSNSNIVNPVILASRHLLIVFSLALATMFFFLSPWFQQVLYHNSDGNAIEVMSWCLPALIGYSFVQIYGTVLTASGYIGVFCRITLIAVLLNIGLNTWLIPVWGAKGSCIAAIASHGFCGIMALIYTNKKCSTPIHLRSMLMYIFIAALLFGFFYWARETGIKAQVQIAVAGVISLGMMLISGFLPVAKWKRIFGLTE